MYNFNKFNEQLSEILKWVEKEFSSIRTGRATITLLDSVFVEAYGSKMPINQTASISQEDPKTLKITPFDFNLSQQIELSITKADLGVSVSNSSTGIRVIFPELTSERREILLKQAGKKAEEARISIRSKREEVKKELQNLKKNSEITEDEEVRYGKEMQGMVDKVNGKIDELLEKKNKEINN